MSNRGGSMKKSYFKVKLLSDVVLQATSNNEGKIENLDFIPGSVFLGIVAKHYELFGKDSFDIFHNGKVRFGDATLMINNKKSYKIPLTFFYEKLHKENIYNYHLLDNPFKYGQLKQIRKGYINDEFHKNEISYSYRQKSAYDKKLRKSKDSAMFGYSAIQKETEFVFCLEYDENINISQVKQFLVGKKNIGKSKTAEYSLVEISEISSIDEIEENDGLVLYFDSRVVLFDENGNPTTDVKYICKNLDVDYEKTQIKISTFTPYNFVRKTKDYERVCIEKGSVVVVKNLTNSQKEEIKKGVGAYLSEGFGKILINPDFLTKEKIEFKKLEDKKEDITFKENETIQFLHNKQKAKTDKFYLEDEVQNFIKVYWTLYKDISKSQWGAIRSICDSNIDNKKTEIEKYISSGIREWSKQQIQELLRYNISFIQLVAINMPKEDR